MGKGYGTYGIGTSQATSLLSESLGTIKREMTMLEAIVLKECKNTVHHCFLALAILSAQIVIHAYAHGTTDGIEHINGGIISGMTPSISSAVKLTVVGIETGNRVG